MKLQDKETLSIADAVSDVLKNKTVKEVSYPHKMYSPEGEEVTATNKEEHESYSAKGYSHNKPVKEETISELTIKSSILQNADWDGRRDSRENPDKLTIQQFIRQEAKKYNLKVKFQKGKGRMQGQPSDLAIFDGSAKDLIDYFNEYYDARMKNVGDLKDFGESLELEGKKFKWKFTTNEELSAGQKKLPPALQKAILKKQGKKEEVKVDESEKQKKYQAFFNKALKKFGAKSPADLDDAKKKEFFDYIDKNYKSGDES